MFCWCENYAFSRFCAWQFHPENYIYTQFWVFWHSKCVDWSSHRHGITKSHISYILEDGSPKVMMTCRVFYLPKSLKIASFSRVLKLFFLGKTLGHTENLQFWNIGICLKNHHFVLQNITYFDIHDLSCNGVIMFSKVFKLTICLHIWLGTVKKWEFQ